MSRVIVYIFGLSLVFYLGTRLGLSSYNTQLSVDNQNLVSEIDSAQADIEDLQSEITLLEDKSRVLGMLDYQVYDDKDNIYVIDNTNQQ